MVVLLAALALTVQAQGLEARQTTDPLLPDTIVRAPDAPALVLLGGDHSGVAALRLSLPVSEGPYESGATRILSEMALDRMRGPAARVGASVSAERTPWGLAYTVAGAEIDVEYLGFLLQTAVADPTDDHEGFRRVKDAVLGSLERSVESPEDRLRTRLARSPDRVPTEGTPQTVGPMTLEGVSEVWRRSHRASSMTVVAATSLEPEVLLASLADIPVGDTLSGGLREFGASPAGDDGAPPPLRRRYGVAYAADGVLDPYAPIAASLLSDRLPGAASGVEVGVRLVETGSGHLMLLTGSTTGRLSILSSTLDDLLPQLREAATDSEVRTAAHLVSHRMRIAASTPEGLVRQVGRAIDAASDIDAAYDYSLAFDSVDARGLRDWIDRLTVRTESVSQ